jgi:Ca2+-binding EF-hand superfamily protein
MNAIDKYDIREAFDALDADCEGSLGFANLLTLYLGLGFATPRRMTVAHLEKDARALGYREDALSLEQTIKLFAKVSATPLVKIRVGCTFPRRSLRSHHRFALSDLLRQYSRDRSTELSECFRALLDDSGEEGSLIYQDLLRASREAGEPLSESNAKHMMTIASGGKERLRQKDFVQLFAPPEP